ncbi:MAG: M1 family aminopeptidase, partial [Saprospiraceae bacterium]
AQTMNYIKSLGLIPGQKAELEPMQSTKEEFIKFIATGKEEELSTHADHFVTNSAYGVASYMKGSLCLFELKYICGDEAFEKGMLSYYWKWRFRHPNPNDFFRTIEQASDLELDWFKEYWVYTKKTIDYRVDTCFEKDGQSVIRLKRIGLFPMPIDLKVNTDKTELNFTIPLDIMRGFKKSKELKVLDPWHWVNPIYEFRIDIPLKKIKEVRIDPKNQLVDIAPENNVWIRNED